MRAAAEYVRMSTEHQQYSTFNQQQKIREFAQQRDIAVIRTYTDLARSGLRLIGRPALQALLADVQSGERAFDIVLVYDVSRWGRFQDADESAYYEYLCRKAGVQVLYCAEQFENDGSPTAIIIKNIKRAMAAEYSRELSIKVFVGQSTIVQHGFHRGGYAGYGLRRTILSPEGTPKTILSIGEHKNIRNDRIILTPGPEHEVNAVIAMFDWYVNERLTAPAIAARLNSEGLLNQVGGPWNRAAVYKILGDERYIGNNLFNRTSCKLKGPLVRNPPEQWVRKDGAFTPVVPIELFRAAQLRLREGRPEFSDEELLDLLRALYQRHGYLSAELIDAEPDMPSARLYAKRFGSLKVAYKKIGFAIERAWWGHERIRREIKAIYLQVAERLQSQLMANGVMASFDPHTSMVLIKQCWGMRLTVVRSQCFRLRYRWRIELGSDGNQDVTLVVRLTPGNDSILDYFLFPRLGFSIGHFSIGAHNAHVVESHRFAKLSDVVRTLLLITG